MPIVLSHFACSMPARRRWNASLLVRLQTHYKSGEFLGPRIGDKIIFGLLILGLYYGSNAFATAMAAEHTTLPSNPLGAWHVVDGLTAPSSGFQHSHCTQSPLHAAECTLLACLCLRSWQ